MRETERMKEIKRQRETKRDRYRKNIGTSTRKIREKAQLLGAAALYVEK